MPSTILNHRSEFADRPPADRPATAQRLVTFKTLSRRDLLKQTAAGMAAGTLAATLGHALAAEATPEATQTDTLPAPPARRVSGKIPISLIIDDGAPVDPLFYEIPGYETPFLVPGEFTRRVAETFERFDLRGKLTIIPMPSCLGRIDKSLKRVPAEHLDGFLKLVRERIAPRFDITPEFLTHLRAYNLKTGDYQHIYEDVWISQAPLDEIVAYFVLAFEILKHVGLNATGITSPWVSGIDVEKKYAQALAEAHWKVFRQKLTWYFLHCTEWGKPRQCSVEYKAPDRDQVVVSVPADECAAGMELLRQSMESVQFDVPMLSEGKWSQKNWGSLEDYDAKGQRIELEAA